jgi:hypothetical protein
VRGNNLCGRTPNCAEARDAYAYPVQGQIKSTQLQFSGLIALMPNSTLHFSSDGS